VGEKLLFVYLIHLFENSATFTQLITILNILNYYVDCPVLLFYRHCYNFFLTTRNIPLLRQ